MRLRYSLIALLWIGLLTTALTFPAASQSYMSEAAQHGFTLKKVVSDTAIATGQNFSYTVYFSIPAGATSVTITDALPASLAFQAVSVTSACGAPAVVSPTVGTLGGTVSLSWASVPGGCSGSFVVTVNFPNGVTCDRTAARNNVCLMGQIGGETADFCTGYVSTTAIAEDPWNIGKWIIGAGSQPGPCNKVTADSVVTYQVCVWKDVGTTGQLNMENAVVTDTLPPGAVLLSSTCGATQSGNVITWNIGSLSALPLYSTTCCTFDVLYPSLLFPTGSQITNRASLSGTLGSNNAPCGQATHLSNETCIEIKQVTSATFSKYVYTNGQPGCTGKYRIWICNNGSLPITSMVVTDTIPATLTGISLGTVSGGLNATLTGNVVTAMLTSPLLPTQCRYIDVDFTIPAAAPVGSVITNCAWMVLPGLPPYQACASFTVAAPAPKPCVWKEVCNKLTSYQPGDVFRYRLRVQNIGGQPITGATITDVLDPNLQFAGNLSYYTASVWNAPCQTTTTWPGVSFSQSGQTLSFSLPTIPANCQTFFYNYCGMYGTSGIPFYFIEFDVMVSDTSALGNIPNAFDISGGTLTGTTTSNTDYVNVVGTTGFLLEKGVAQDTTSWASSTTTTASSTVNYRLRLTVAPGSVGLRHITFADLLPRDDGTNDNLILGPCSPRGSIFDLGYASTVATTPAASAYSNPLSFATVNTFAPVGSPGGMFTGGCGTLGSWGSGATAGDNNVGWYFGSTPVAAGNSATSVFAVQLPSTAVPGDSACNTFAANGAVRHLINSSIISDQPTGSLESGPACVFVQQGQGGKDTCFTAAVKAITASGTDPVGNCLYTVELTLNNPATGSLSGWFESDQGTVLPGTLTVPPGITSQLFTFTDMPPADSIVCIRFGIIDGQGQRRLCDSVCFALPPCDEDPCDSVAVKVNSVISTGVDSHGDCTYDVSIGVTNTGSAPSVMWFDSFSGAVTPAVLTVPSGSSTQLLSFTDTPPTDAFVCIRYGYVDAQGQRILCDSICFDLPPCSDGPCDSISVKTQAVTPTGVDPTGNCVYDIDIDVTNTGSSPLAMWFDSFSGSVTPSSYTAPTGISSTTLSFTDLPPADSFVCIRFGYMGPQGQRIVCDSICFDLPPCGDDPCDSLSMKLKSINATGVDANGDCLYDVTFDITNAGSSPVPFWFASYGGAVAPPLLTVASGSTTQTFTFTDTPPTDNFVCIRYGYMGAQGLRVLCDSVCFDLPPCGDGPCDSLINGQLDSSCCEYDVTIANGVGSPITSISYTVIGGTVDNITTAPCAPTVPAPVGSTSGVLTYSPPCPGSMGFSIQATPTTSGGTVTVQLVVHHGQKDSCRLQFSYTCDDKHQQPEHCDDVKVKPFLFAGLSLSGRSFTVFNTKVPASPITHIDISPVPTACVLQGGALKVDFVPTAWSLPYTRIPNSGFISAGTEVKFNLGIDYTCNWTGVINLVIHHADGDSCLYTYGPWKALPPIVGTGGVLTGTGIPLKVYGNKLRLQNTHATRPVKWVSVNVVSDSSVIIAGSGDHWEGTQLESGYELLDGYEQGRKEALFSFESLLAAGSTSGYFNLVVARDSMSTLPPVIRWTTYDDNGDAIATDTVSIGTPVLSIRGGGSAPAPGDFQLLHFFPSPVKNAATINYVLGRDMQVRLDLYDRLGQYIETIDEGYRQRGTQSLRYSSTRLPAGTYYLRLSSGTQQVTKPMVIMR